MSEKPTGVFVRLPLSETDARKIRSAIDTPSYEPESLSAELLAIGTPVTGGELPTEVVRVREHRPDINLPWVYLKTPPSDQDASEYELEVERLLTHEQAQSQIAVLEAEIVRLREALEESRNAIMSDLNAHSIVCTVWAAPSETLVDYIDAALKGGVA